MRTNITLSQFIVSCIINGLNSFFYFLAYEITFNYRFLVFLTIITLDFNSIYLFLSFICDISLFIFKSTKLEVLNNFLRNKLCHVANPISYTVTVLFWGIAAFGGMGDIFANFIFIILIPFKKGYGGLSNFIVNIPHKIPYNIIYTIIIANIFGEKE